MIVYTVIVWSVLQEICTAKKFSMRSQANALNVYLWGHLLNPEKYKLQTLHFSPHRSKIVFWNIFSTKCCSIYGTYGKDIIIQYLKRLTKVTFRFCKLFVFDLYFFIYCFHIFTPLQSADEKFSLTKNLYMNS